MSIVNSTVVIYKDCKITPDRNFLVDNITDYLQLIAIGAQTLTDFQYIEHALNLTITLNAESATWLNPHSTATRYNYCSIQNDSDSFPIYYFIVDKHWTSKKTVTLSLVMDTINSFRVGTDYTLGDKTQVTREHKDRVYFGTVTHGGETYYRRKIDFLSEGITPVLYKQNETVIREQGDSGDWYLMYVAHNATPIDGTPIAVDAFLLSDNSLNIKSEVGDFYLSADSIDANHLYFFGNKVTGSQRGQFKFKNKVYNIDELMEFERNDDELILKRFTGTSEFGFLQTEEVDRWEETSGLSITFYSNRPIYYTDDEDLQEVLEQSWTNVGTRILQLSHNRTVTPTGDSPSVEGTVDSLSTVDRTNTKLLKILALPYSPFDIDFDESGDIVIPSYVSLGEVNWGTEGSPVIKNYLLVNSDYTKAFENSLDIPNSGSGAIKVFENLFTQIDLDQDTRNDANESKLYHSDYYVNRFVYDSFSYPIQLENISQQKLQFIIPSTPLEVNMVTTNTINSNFLFDFRNLGDYKTTEDYDHLLIVSRNNEVTLYNSEYINYIKNGYNYDKKSRIANNIQSAFGVVGSAISTTVGGFGVGSAVSSYRGYMNSLREGGYFVDSLGERHWSAEFYGGLKKPRTTLDTLYATGQLASGISGIFSGINSIIQNEASFKQKQEQIKQSSVSVSGSDDLDLLKYYSSNKAKVCEYKVSTLMKNKLADLFYYCGYDAGGEQKSPDLNTRKWFNYIQCTPEIKSTKNISQDIIDELKNRWAVGVTILHENNSLYDWDQTKANNERWLYINE